MGVSLGAPSSRVVMTTVMATTPADHLAILPKPEIPRVGGSPVPSPFMCLDSWYMWMLKRRDQLSPCEHPFIFGKE